MQAQENYTVPDPLLPESASVKAKTVMTIVMLVAVSVWAAPRVADWVNKNKEEQAARQTVPTVTLTCAKTPNVFDDEDARLPHVNEITFLVPPTDCLTVWVGRPRDKNGMLSRRFWFDNDKPIETEYYRENKTTTALGTVGPFDEIRISGKPKLTAARFRNTSGNAVTLTAYLR